ncbi:MAG: tetratricopeptide repeat protein [Bacteroidia bacterium]|nr:tetratricopeptide repeat protein [Bacteroidia bacterium]
MAVCYGDIASVYEQQSDYKNAIENYLPALKLYEKINNIDGITFCLNQLGNTYYALGKYAKALEYLNQCLAIDEKQGNTEGIVMSLNNLANNYQKLGLLDTAYTLHNRLLNIRLELGDSLAIAQSLGNLGSVLSEQKKYDNALKYFSNALKLFTNLKKTDDIGISYNNIAEVYMKRRMFTQALENAMLGLQVAREANLKSVVKDIYKTLSKIFELQQDYGQAFRYQQLYNEIKDSLITEESTRLIAEMQTSFETEKKEKEIELLSKEKELQKSAINRRNIIIWSTIGGLILVIFFIVFLWNRFVIIRSQKSIIERQKIIVDKKSKELQTALSNITDSINYAKRIQQAVLPTGEYANNILSEHFIFFKPKDIVSGDFYWATRINEWLIVTVADCTGHGIPGAFMSMLGVSFLNEIVRKKEITNASEVLDHLRVSIIEALQQKGKEGEQQDGMDIAFCAINTITSILQFAGAKNSLCIIQKDRPNEVKELKAARMPVGIYIEMPPFPQSEISLTKGDIIYLSSDGYIDQFGGENRKKLTNKKYKEILLKISKEPMNIQKEMLIREFNNWIGENEQIDDVTVLGIRI